MPIINPALDASGNGNNWTPININYFTSGVTYDTVTDVPTNTNATTANYCVINPLSPQGAAIVVSAGNLQFTRASTGDVNALGSLGMSSGKWYWEVTSIANNSGTATTQLGIASSSFTGFTTAAGNSSQAWVFTSGAFKANNNVYTSGFGSTWSTGDVLMIAFDASAGKVWFGRNGTWIASGNPAAGTNEAFGSIPSGTYFHVGGINGSADNMAANFGQRGFAYTPPSGFVALNTFNLPTPTIGATASTQANRYMDISLYTGNASALTVSGLNFSPDLVWIKPRVAAFQHQWYDQVRGALKRIGSSSANAENTETETLKTFTSNGFTLGNDVGTNPASAVVAWNWNAGGSTVTNTSGTISAQVRANTTAGFSIVTYTGTGANATVGHGLGVAPRMIIIKSRSGVYNWRVWHTALSSTELLFLNTTDAVQTGQTTAWNSTLPTSTVFSLGSSGGVNESASTLVAYCFAPVAGYSAFGSYTGNGSADGPFIYTGFRPRYVMWKRTNTSGDSWWIIDSARSPENVADDVLLANLSNSESVQTTPIDFLSNGFKMRNGADGSINASGSTYIYMAFAESPFKFANAR
jgi:hypothetical protein